MIKFSFIKGIKLMLWVTSGILIYSISQKFFGIGKKECSPRRLPVSYVDPKIDHEIPRIIHQTFQTKSLPPKFQQWQKSCKDLHPNWQYKLWTDNDIKNLVERDFPHLAQRFHGYKEWINRVDMARYFELTQYGGFFMDLDVECLRSHERFAKWGGVWLVQMSYDTKGSWPEHNIPNSWMASVKGHPLFAYFLQQMNDSDQEGVEAVGGSVFMYEHVFKFKGNDTLPEINFVQPGLVFPYDWRIQDEKAKYCAAQSEEFSASKCKSFLPLTSYAVTYFTKIWGDWRMLGPNGILSKPNV